METWFALSKSALEAIIGFLAGFSLKRIYPTDKPERLIEIDLRSRGDVAVVPAALP